MFYWVLNMPLGTHQKSNNEMYETTVACLQWLRETIHDLSSHVNQWYEKNLKSCLKILKIGCINPLRVPRTYIYVNPVHASSSRATTVHAFRVHQGRIYTSLAVGKKIARHAKGKEKDTINPLQLFIFTYVIRKNLSSLFYLFKIYMC